MNFATRLMRKRTELMFQVVIFKVVIFKFMRDAASSTAQEAPRLNECASPIET
jgi:hypothetical protein